MSEFEKKNQAELNMIKSASQNDRDSLDQECASVELDLISENANK